MQLGAEILGERNKLAQRYDDLAREREELSFDADMLNDVRAEFPSVFFDASIPTS